MSESCAFLIFQMQNGLVMIISNNNVTHHWICMIDCRILGVQKLIKTSILHVRLSFFDPIPNARDG